MATVPRTHQYQRGRVVVIDERSGDRTRLTILPWVMTRVARPHYTFACATSCGSVSGLHDRSFVRVRGARRCVFTHSGGPAAAARRARRGGPARPESAAAHPEADRVRRTSRVFAGQQARALSLQDVRRRHGDRSGDRRHSQPDGALSPFRLHARALSGERPHSVVWSHRVQSRQRRCGADELLAVRARSRQQRPSSAPGRQGRGRPGALPQEDAHRLVVSGGAVPRGDMPPGSSQMHEADIVYENGVPKLANQRKILDSRDVPFRPPWSRRTTVRPRSGN